MSLRITSSMINSQLLNNLNRNMKVMSNQQNQISTGRKINKPSDDPVGVTYALRYRSELSANEQFQKNVDTALGWVNTTDSVMSQAEEVMNRIKSLAVQGSSGSNPQNALDSIESELQELKKQLGELGNTQFNGKYIFNGQTYDTMPYNLADPNNLASVQTDSQGVTYNVGQGVTFQINSSGNEFFGSQGETDNIFAIIDRLSVAMKNGKFDDIAAESTHIESRMNTMLSTHAEVGARTNRVELMQNRLSNEDLSLNELQSKVEDTDIAEMMIKSSVSQNIYQASLQVGAKIISPTLVDFIR